MNLSSSTYLLEKDDILRKAYQLLTLFLANKQLSSLTLPDQFNDPLWELDSRFLYRETSTLLLEVAILFRALDDQLSISEDRYLRSQYLSKVKETNKRYEFDMFEKLTIRACCNKIIHATTFIPITIEGVEIHSRDIPACYGDGEKRLAWHHLNGDVRITGKHQDKSWAYLISIPEFVEALSYLLGSCTGK